MKSSERPEDGQEERRPKGRRWGRSKPEAAPEDPGPGEDFGWIDDLRSAKQQRGELGPDAVSYTPLRAHATSAHLV
ncbi:hypothetical protein, partial [Verrucosispora sp. SN26_14.1]|uniref:hypothetical protein n=1 Tax=Verrucosispora sp. SN26_14.1 TaxID=2527879 RepID=UPI001F166C1B